MEKRTQHKEITRRPPVDEIDKVANSLGSMEAMISLESQCCIYKVPDYIRKGKEECYDPFAISIGPVFYNDPKLEAMQELKRIFLKAFRKHPNNASQSYELCIKFVRDQEYNIRECYEEQISLQSDEFIQMIVLDAAFLIYLFLAWSESDDHPSKNAGIPFIKKKLWLLFNSLGRDLFLEENQLPFFVLKGIYQSTFNEVNPRCSFTELALSFIGILGTKIPGKEAIMSIIEGRTITDASNIQHLVDLQMWCCCLPFYDLNDNRNQFHKFPSAKHLSVAGVKFESSKSDNPLDIRFDRRNGVLQIPKLHLMDKTEPMLRSILFFEQCDHVHEQKCFTDYICFLDMLIDNQDDVHVLQEKEIIDNIIGSNEEAANLFNKLPKNISYNVNKFAFSDVSKGLKDYASTPRNRWKAILWSRYLNHPWAIISVIYAIVLLILTLLQTMTGFLQV